MIRRIFIFGPGYVGLALARRMRARGVTVMATARSMEQRAALRDDGIRPVDPANPGEIAAALAEPDAILITAAPTEAGCPALAALAAPLARARRPQWIGYLSTTGVYGDRGGGWVNEWSALAPISEPGRRRMAAEDGWRSAGAAIGAPVHVFRLPGIYGPGRSAFDRLREGTARRIVRPGQVFSRIHRDDIVSALAASIARGGAGLTLNLCDDEAGPPQDVIAYAAGLMGIDPPPEVAFEEAQITGAGRRFFEESKRVSNARAKAALGWRPMYPTYREGLAAVLAADGETSR